MRSAQFERTFERASAIIEAGTADPLVSLVLADLQARASGDEENPIRNRDLIVDPRVDAQMIAVPEATYRVVVDELRQFQLLHVWARAICPNDGEVIVETRNPDKFKRLLSEPCPHCGQCHSNIDASRIETFLAINFQLSDKRLSVRELLSHYHPPPATRTGVVRKAWKRLSLLFRNRDDSPVEQATAALAENRPAQVVPTTERFFWTLCGVSAVWWIVQLAICSILYYAFGLPTASIVTFIALSLVYTFLAYVAWRWIYNKYPVQRQILVGTKAMGGGLLLAGASGVTFSLEWDESKPMKGLVAFGQPNEMLVGYGVLLVVAGYVICGCTHVFEKSFETRRRD